MERTATEPEYRTGDFHLAAFLVCQEHTLVDIRRLSGTKVVFCFELTELLARHIREYEGHTALVNARDLIAAQKEVKATMYRVIEPCIRDKH